MKPLDIVLHTSGNIGVITEGKNKFSITWFDVPSIQYSFKTAWWSGKELEELTVIGNLANFIARGLCHPFGSNENYANEVYPYK